MELWEMGVEFQGIKWYFLGFSFGMGLGRKIDPQATKRERRGGGTYTEKNQINMLRYDTILP